MRITHSKNAGNAKRYFELSDYLDADPNHLLKGQWFGTGAKFLGLSGEVDKNLFDRLVDNQMPFEDARLTQRQHADRRVGTDLTFSAPKSVSLLWAMTQDNAILEAVQQAANATLADLEQDAQTRVNHSRGHMTLAKTGNIVGASWLHTTSRPVDGYPDPSLHVHSFVLNATKAGDRWDVVEFVTKGKGGFKASDRLVVANAEAGRVTAIGTNGQIPVPIDSPKSFDVYRKVERRFAKGDTVRITKNRRPDRQSGEKRLNNGALFTVIRRLSMAVSAATAEGEPLVTSLSIVPKRELAKPD